MYYPRGLTRSITVVPLSQRCTGQKWSKTKMNEYPITSAGERASRDTQ
jgi:hypothetical protein